MAAELWPRPAEQPVQGARALGSNWPPMGRTSVVTDSFPVFFSLHPIQDQPQKATHAPSTNHTRCCFSVAHLQLLQVRAYMKIFLFLTETFPTPLTILSLHQRQVMEAGPLAMANWIKQPLFSFGWFVLIPIRFKFVFVISSTITSSILWCAMPRTMET